MLKFVEEDTMDTAKKRSFTDLADTNPDDLPIAPSPSRQQRSRITNELKHTCTFDQLDEYCDFMVIPKNVLEDYLTTWKLKDIRPTTLDTSDGTWEEIDSYMYGDLNLKIQSNVLLVNGTFLRIEKILEETEHGYIVLRGSKFIPTSSLKPILDDGTNEYELFWDLKDIEGSHGSVKEQSLIDIPVRLVEEIVNIQLCNYERGNDTTLDIYFCRWKLIRYYQDSRRTRRSTQVAIERLHANEADNGFRTPDNVLKFSWRGTLSKDPSKETDYTALDGFCCSGGWSRGASMAGSVKVVRSFDADEKACKSYQMNFPETNCLNVDVFDYCLPQRLPFELQGPAISPEYVDIAHYSTPCQFFSPAHTRVGINDEKNFAASFCLANLLNKDRPRVVTFENTFGLERMHFTILQAIFGQITSQGYSLRFATLNLANWGLPQRRRRLIMLASCPGEPLPTFPEPTHSCDGEIPDTLPWVSMHEIIKGIPFEGWQNHNPNMMKRKPLPKKAKTIADTITCSGGNQANHPEGRQYTICEFQMLQGFPLHHRFAKGLSRHVMLGQIGNAFPPLFVKKLIRHIRKQLQETDGLEIPIDEDDYMSEAEIREKEIEQFFNDHENLPAGTRANIQYTSATDQYDDDEDDLEGMMVEGGEDEMDHARSWGWIDSDTDQRPSSSGSESAQSPESNRSFSSSLTSASYSFERSLKDLSLLKPNFSFAGGLKTIELPRRATISTKSTRTWTLTSAIQGARRTKSLSIRTRQSPDCQIICPSTSSSTIPNTAKSGRSVEDAIDLD